MALDISMLVSAAGFAFLCGLILIVADRTAGRIEVCTPRLHRSYDAPPGSARIMIDRVTDRGPLAVIRLSIRLAIVALAFCVFVLGFDIAGRLLAG